MLNGLWNHQQNNYPKEKVMLYGFTGCDCSSSRKDEERSYVLKVVAYIEVDACCEQVARDANYELADADDWEIVDVEEA